MKDDKARDATSVENAPRMTREETPAAAMAPVAAVAAATPKGEGYCRLLGGSSNLPQDRTPFARGALAVVLLLGFARAQAPCREWAPRFSTPGPNGSVRAIARFDDSTGPSLVVGGQFTALTTKTCSHHTLSNSRILA